jgi:hypothetical protein
MKHCKILLHLAILHDIVPLRQCKSYITLFKKPSVTQDQNTRVTENSIIHVE